MPTKFWGNVWRYGGGVGLLAVACLAAFLLGYGIGKVRRPSNTPERQSTIVTVGATGTLRFGVPAISDLEVWYVRPFNDRDVILGWAGSTNELRIVGPWNSLVGTPTSGLSGEQAMKALKEYEGQTVTVIADLIQYPNGARAIRLIRILRHSDGVPAQSK